MANSKGEDGSNVFCSLVSVSLIAAAVYELSQGDIAIAMMMFLAVPVSLAVAWMIRRPGAPGADDPSKNRRHQFPQAGSDRI